MKDTPIIHKIGRNDPCFCGSGKKYKKCCLLNPIQQESEPEAPHYEKALLQKMMAKVQEQHKDKGYVFSTAEELGLTKMSELVIELAQDFLESAETYREQQSILTLAVIAWNVAVLSDHEKKDLRECVDSFLPHAEMAEDSEERAFITTILLTLASKKQFLFPNIHRTIVHYEIKRVKNEVILNVASVGASSERKESIFPKINGKQPGRPLAF